jgi:hypothetical protein
MAEHLAKIARIRDELNRGFLERADLIDGALTALLSSNHVLVIGPPGNAKPMRLPAMKLEERTARHHRSAANRKIDARRRAVPAHRGRQLFPMAAD